METECFFRKYLVCSNEEHAKSMCNHLNDKTECEHFVLQKSHDQCFLCEEDIAGPSLYLAQSTQAEIGPICATCRNIILGELEIPVIYTTGALSIESEVRSMRTCAFGLQRACDGRVWVCINGSAFVRFKPER